MLILLSPSKKLNMDAAPVIETPQIPVFLAHSTLLIEQLKTYNPQEIQSFMKISEALSLLNYQRFQAFSTPFTTDNAKQAILAFSGDVYDGLNATDFTPEEHHIGQQKIRILSGLYGLIAPLDLIQAYRLEMGRKLATARGKNLYDFWGDLITQHINTLSTSDYIINLASNEYSKAIKKTNLKGHFITIDFKEKKGDDYKIIGLFAKRARGMMARYIIQNNCNTPKELHHFNHGNYQFNPALSNQNTLTFTR